MRVEIPRRMLSLNTIILGAEARGDKANQTQLRTLAAEQQIFP